MGPSSAHSGSGDPATQPQQAPVGSASTQGRRAAGSGASSSRGAADARAAGLGGSLANRLALAYAPPVAPPGACPDALEEGPQREAEALRGQLQRLEEVRAVLPLGCVRRGRRAYPATPNDSRCFRQASASFSFCVCSLWTGALLPHPAHFCPACTCAPACAAAQERLQAEQRACAVQAQMAGGMEQLQDATQECVRVFPFFFCQRDMEWRWWGCALSWHAHELCFGG